MKCPKCYKDNLPAAVFCADCGAKLSRPTSAPKQPLSNRTMIVDTPRSAGYSRNLTEVLIGRGENCDILINDSSVSTKHAKIFVENEQLYIEDLKSMNGTYVNGRKVLGKRAIGMHDKINLGNQTLDARNPILTNLFMKYGSAGAISETGMLSLRMNTKWVGKIFYFAMLLLFFFPWLSFRSEKSESISALDFAFKKYPAQFSAVFDGPVHTFFVIIFILLIIGLLMNFLTLKISEKFNYTNIVSIVVCVLTIGYIYLVSFADTYFGERMNTIIFQHNFSVFMFLILSLVSIFEGVIEYYVDERKKYYN